MLLARAPVRISFAGGGTDLPDYYNHFGGMVVSAAIDKYFYVFVNDGYGDGVHISSSDYRAFYRWSPDEEPAWDGDLRLPRAILHEFGIGHGLSIFLASEIPPGTGLGSSSTVAVALVKALSTFQGHRLTPQEVAETAACVEIERLGSPIGKQDQYAAAVGGVNAVYFGAGGVRVDPLRLSAETRAALQSRLLLFFTGASRSANVILQKQRSATRDSEDSVLAALHALRALAHETRAALEMGQIDCLGEILHEGWMVKRGLAEGISNPHIDEIYERARACGAAGGKVTGAGGGGFLLLYARDEYQPAVCQEMASLGLYRMDFNFDEGGAKVLMNSAPRSGVAGGMVPVG
jgi:D-glycero-alpha-D-manno-heptose-7-phosphate kinase